MAEEKTYVFGNDSQGLWSALPAMLSSRGVDPSILAAFGNRGFLGGDGDILALIILFAIYFSSFLPKSLIFCHKTGFLSQVCCT